MNIIVFFDPHHTDDSGNERVLGHWKPDGEDGVMAEGEVAKSILDTTLARTTIEEAWKQYASWSNGYVASLEIEVADDEETKAWDPTRHPRNALGRFIQVGGGHWRPDSSPDAVPDVSRLGAPQAPSRINMDRNTIKRAEKIMRNDGWEFGQGGKHKYARHPNGHKFPWDGTYSDSHSWDNALAQIRRDTGYDVKAQLRSGRKK